MDEEWETKVKIWMEQYQIQNINFNLICEALTHSSFKGMGYKGRDNERLEFLGDSVLDLIVAHQLILNPQLSEGIMTERRKDLVRNEELALLFDKLELKDLTRTANDFEFSIKNKADYIEALFGAIFLDKGYPRCVEFWEVIQELYNFFRYEKEIGLNESSRNVQKGIKMLVNAKNALQEYCQKLGLSLPAYSLLFREGLEHRPIFTVEVIVKTPLEEIRLSESASTKKKAGILAAEKMCDQLGIEYDPI